MKHTKGKWFATEINTDKKWINISSSEKGIIGRTYYGDLEPVITKEEAEANAKLIAAAPELLEQLQSIIDGSAFDKEKGLIWKHRLDEIEKVIKKATELY